MGSFISLIPTPSEHVEFFFELAPVSAGDVLYDLGSGDGRLVFAAIEHGAGKAVGVELNPEHVASSRKKAKEMGLAGRVEFVNADVMDIDLSSATVVFCYLITAASIALRPKFDAELKPGTRVVMESFPVPDWEPDRVLTRAYKTLYLYRMPPKIDMNYKKSLPSAV
jgi:ubiquinone/menaquinone biosynthesis C-methylase UbiE